MPNFRSARTMFSATCLALLAAVVLAPASAVAQLPGANGWIEMRVEDHSGGTNKMIETIDWQTGADASPPFAYAPSRQNQSAMYLSDGLHVMSNYRISDERYEPISYEANGAGKYRGALIGEATKLQAFYQSTFVYPGGTPSGAGLCEARATGIPLADGNILWRSRDSDYHEIPPTYPANPCAGGSRDNQHMTNLEFVVTTPGGTIVRRSPNVQSLRVNQFGVDEFSQMFSGGDPDVFYTLAYESAAYMIYRNVISTGAREPVRSLPYSPTDISSTGATAIGTTSEGIVATDLATGVQRTVVSKASTAAVEPATALPGSLDDPRFSPDNTSIAFVRDNTTEAGGSDALMVVGVDGANPRVIRAWPAGREASGPSWRVAPGMTVEVTGDSLIGDYMEIDLRVSNVLDGAVDSLEYQTLGAAPGLQFNVAPFEDHVKLGYTLAGGPVPALPGSIPGRTTYEGQYLIDVNTRGNAYLRAYVSGTPANKSRVSVPSEIVAIEATPRKLDKWEQAATAAGGYAELQRGMQREADETYDKTWKLIMKTVKSTVPKRDYATMSKTTPFERGLARAAGLPDDALSWLPNDRKTALESYAAFQKSNRAATKSTLKRALGSAYKTTVQTPFEFWSDHLTGDPTTSIPVGTQIYEESLFWQDSARSATQPYVQGVYDAVTSEKGAVDMADAIDASILSFGTGVEKTAKVAPQKLRQLKAQIEKDPVKAAGTLGTIYGTVRTELAMAAATAVFSPNKAQAAGGITRAGKRIENFMGMTDEVVDTTRTLDRMRTIDKAADTLPTAAKLGMGKVDQDRWMGVVDSVEASVKQKFGVDVDLSLGFRPRNYHSSLIKDGMGKNFFVKKIKAGDDIDLMLGMDPSGLGKAVVYKPKRPVYYKDLPAPVRKQLDERFADMTAGYKEWHDPKSALGRAARRKNGVTLTANVGEGASKGRTLKVKMKVSGVEKNGTISIRYNELIVDGRTIVKKGSKPKWMVSDYDGNSILQVGGKDLPPSLRGFIELETMRLQREAGVQGMAVSFHGFTKNGFDVKGADYRHVFKFIVEGLDDKQAEKALKSYLNKYGAGAYKKLFNDGNYKNNDFVITVTRQGVTTGHGY